MTSEPLFEAPATSSSRPRPPSPALRAGASVPWLAIGFSVLAVTTLCVVAFSRRDLAVFVYGRFSYWIVLALLVTWGWTFLRWIMGRGILTWRFFRRYSAPLLAAAVMSGLAVNSVEPKFRVLSDETNLLGVSQAMFYHKTAFNSPQQKRYYGLMNPLEFQVEKRPLVFPFLAQVVHVLRGYSPQNPFVLNVGVLFATLALAGIAICRLGGPTAAVAAVVLVGSYPLVVLTATSGGFDLLATALVGLAFVLAYVHMREPCGGCLALLTLTLLVLANVRYESAVYVAIIVLGLVVFKYVRVNFIQEQWPVYALAPFSLLPLIVQRILIPHPYENPSGTPAFAWAHCTKFIGVFGSSLQNLDFLQPHAPPLYWFAGPILAFCGVCLLRRSSTVPPQTRHLLILVGAAYLASHAILFSYYFGDFSHPSSARLFLNLSVLVTLLPVALHLHMPRVFTASRLLIFAIVFALVYHPVTVQGRFPRHQFLLREAEFEWDLLRKRDESDVLVIAARPGHFTVCNYGAVDFAYANRHAADLLNELRRHLYSDIIVFQRIAYGNPDVPTADHLDPSFQLQKLAELQTSATEYVRASRVVAY